MSWTVSNGALAAWLRERMDEVEGLLREAASCPRDARLTEAATHLIEAGGKRLRPTVALLAARFGDPHAPHVARAAATVELIHVASLYHDDVMDSASLRRGVISANARWGNKVAILVGDYLVSRTAELAAPLGRAALEDQAHALTRLVVGQFRETFGAGPAGAVGAADGGGPDADADADAERHYLGVVSDKTAALFALAARLGARAAGADPEVTRALGDYGEHLGTAFQLADDLLDITAPTGTAGKANGTDLRLGVPTLPVLRARQARGKAAARVRKALGDAPLADARRRATATTLLRRSPAIGQARAELVRYTDRARAALDATGDHPARQPLEELCAHVAARAGALPAPAGRA